MHRSQITVARTHCIPIPPGRGSSYAQEKRELERLHEEMVSAVAAAEVAGEVQQADCEMLKQVQCDDVLFIFLSQISYNLFHSFPMPFRPVAFSAIHFSLSCLSPLFRLSQSKNVNSVSLGYC